MEFQYTLFVVLAPLAAAISFGIIGYALQYRARIETPALLGLLSMTSGWLIFNTLELVSGTDALTIFWSKVSYAFIAGTPVAWLAFALQYTGKDAWLKFPRFAPLWIVPILTTVLVQTTEQHGLVWEAYTFHPINRWLAFSVDHGPWFWVHLIYSYILILLGAYLISRQYLRSFRLYRQQSILLLLGAIVPLVINFVYVFDMVPGWRKDYTSIGFAFAGTAFAFGILRYRLFELQPVARDALVESMPDAMFVFDLRGRLVDVNPVGHALLGMNYDNLVGSHFNRLLEQWPELKTYLNAVDVNVNRAHEDLALEVLGEDRHYDLRISPLTNARGQLTGRLFLLRDVTARKQAEAALRERTGELEERNEDLDAFAHTVAHDLKSPLTVFIGYVQILSRRADVITPGELRDVLAMLEQNGQKMANIVDELLLLASVRKLEEVDLNRLNMGRIVSDALRRLSLLIRERGADVIVPDIWPEVLGYSSWVEEVWVNYISNALKYGGTPPRVELKYELLDSGPPRVRFCVCDNGAGISAEEQARLFTLFTRLNQVRIEGHGLGLSIVRRIVEKLGGEVGVESELGQGSCFHFTLPVVVPDEEFNLKPTH